MAGSYYGIQTFRDAGCWQPLGAYQHMTLEAAMAEAAAFAENLYAWPLGLRVTGPKEWVSDRIGGRVEITLLHNPITDVWTVGCTKCKSAEDTQDVYAATKFARHHQC